MADRTVVVRFLAEMSQFNAAMGKSVAATQTLRTSQARTATATQASMTRMGRSADGFKGSLGGITPMLVGAGGLAYGVKSVTDAAIGWESAFAGVKKTVTGTPEQLERISDGIRDMSKEIPTSAEDLAAIAESAGQLGIETDNILEFTRVIADLGETTNLTGQEGATTLARFANITQMSQGDFDRLGSTIVDLGNNFETTESEIADMALRLAGAGSQVGMSEADILGLATALSSVGIEAESGGTAYTRVLTDIQGAVDTSSEKLDQFAEVAGMTAGSFADLWKADPSRALARFVGGLDDIKKSGGNVTSTLEDLELGEIRVSDALRRTSGNADGLTEALDVGNQAWEDNTARQEEAAQRYETTEAKIDTAKNAVHDFSIEIGEVFLPAVDAAADATADWFDMKPPAWMGGANQRTYGDQAIAAVKGAAGQFGMTDDYEQPFKLPGDDLVQAERPGMGFGDDGTWQIVAKSEEALAALERLQNYPAPDWTRIEEGTGVLDEVRESTEILEDRLVGFQTPDPDWSRIEAGTDVMDDVRSESQKVLDELKPFESPPADWSRIEAGTQVLDTVGTAAMTNGDRIQDYLDKMNGINDGMFGFRDAVRQQEQAQSDYNEAVEEFGKKSPEAIDAAWDLGEATSRAENAAMNSELSYGKFDDKLAQWVETGKITQDQANKMRGDFQKLRGEAEDYEGNYDAYLAAEMEKALEDVRRLEAEAQAYEDSNPSTDFSANIDPAMRRIQQVREALGDIPRSISTTVTTSYTSRGETVANIPGRGRLLVGDQRNHDGGTISEATTGWMPGLASDERLRVLQVGETVQSARDRGSSSVDNSRTSQRIININAPIDTRTLIGVRSML